MSETRKMEDKIEFSESLCFVLDYIEKKCKNNYKNQEELLNNITKITDVLVNTTLDDDDYDILIRCSNTLKRLFSLIVGINTNILEELKENNQIIYLKLLEKYNNSVNDTLDYHDDLVNDSSYDIYKAYSNDIKNGNYKLLTFGEEQELGKRIKKQDKEAVKKLVTSNLWLVYSIAKDFQRDDVEFMDLIEIGNEALIKAAYKFDYTKNIKFSTYATIYITGYLQRYRSLYQTGTCLNPYLTIRLNRFLKVYNSLDDDFFGDKLKETVKILDINEKEGKYLLQLSKGHYSLNQKISDESEEEFINTLPSDENIENKVLDKIFIEEIFKSNYLKRREKIILKLRYGIGMDSPFKLEEISKIMNLEPANISRIEKIAIRKIRSRNKEKEDLKK